MNNKKNIAILLPYNEDFSKSKAGAAAIWVKEFNSASKYKNNIHVYGINDLKNMIYQINNIEISCKKNPRSSAPILFNFLTGLCKKASC